MIKKKWYMIGLLFVIVFALTLTAGCDGNQQPPEQQEEKETLVLKLSHSAAPQSVTGRSYVYFAETLEKESQGSIKVEVSPSGNLVPEQELFNAVQKGNIDLGHMALSYATPVVKELTPLEVPGAYPGDKFIELAEAVRPVIDKMMSKYGVRYIGRVGADNMVFVGRNIAVKTSSDLQGAKVRTVGKWAGEAVKAWGGAPITISIADLPNALERGTVDLALTNWIPVQSFKLYEVASNISITDMPASFCGLIMSDKTWQKLDADQQEAILRAAKKLEEYNYEITQQEYEKFLQNASGANCTVYVLSPDENQSFKNEVVKLLEEVKKSVAGPESAELIEIFESMSE